MRHPGHIWKVSSLHRRVQGLCIVSVGSVLTYGSEDWMMTNDVKRMLNGTNNMMLGVITGHTDHKETPDGSITFNLVRADMGP